MLTTQTLRDLAHVPAGACLSLYFKARPPGTTGRAMRLELDAALERGRGLLAERAGARVAERIVAPLVARAAELSAPEHPGAFAAFAREGLEADFRVPGIEEDLIVVADSFHVRPLLRWLQFNRRYFLLSLSQHHARLVRGTAEGLSPADVPGLPATLEQALKLDKRDAFVFSHASAAGRAGRSPIFHGHGADGGPTEEDLLHYFRAVDRAVWNVLREERAALVLAAPTEQHALYRLANRYPYLLGRGIDGNYQRAPLAELHERAWPLVAESAAAHESELVETFGQESARGRASAELSTIARHSVEGRVRTLFLADGVRLAGRLDRRTGDVALADGAAARTTDDLLDDVAEAVLLRSGDVLGLARERMPGKSEIAALLRW